MLTAQLLAFTHTSRLAAMKSVRGVSSVTTHTEAIYRMRQSPLFHEAAYINGKWSEDSPGGAPIKVVDPASGLIVGHVPDVGRDGARAAIKGASDAWPAWRRMSAKERGGVLRRWHDLLLKNKDELATIATLEMGKPKKEALGEIAFGAAFLEWFAEDAKRCDGSIIPANKPSQKILVYREPVGVVSAITPWNFPMAMIARKVGAALAAGCPIVVKPAELSPFSALAMAHLSREAGVPDGVFSVVTGQPEPVGDELTTSEIVRKFSFTGSTRVGKYLAGKCMGTVKKVSLELGGNAPFIVFESADLDAAVVGAIASKFRNSGQTCVCANRILVQDTVYDEFAARLAKAVRGLTLGFGLDDVTLGPLVSADAVQKVKRHVDNAVANGARVVVGGNVSDLGDCFFQPTLITNATASMAVANEETFGPLAALIKFSSEAEAIKMANNTPMGLASYFYSRDLGQCFRVSEALEYGMVGVNEGLMSNEAAPFGGVKQSGLGREGSKYGLDDYTELKYVLMGGLDK